MIIGIEENYQGFSLVIHRIFSKFGIKGRGATEETTIKRESFLKLILNFKIFDKCIVKFLFIYIIVYERFVYKLNTINTI